MLQDYRRNLCYKMSHQTGIKSNEELLKFFGNCHNGNTRVFKVNIEDEELQLGDWKSSISGWEQDYDKLVLPLLINQTPCFLLYRLDAKSNGSGKHYDWLLIIWVPDDSPVRQKMLYASTKATLKLEFGAANITAELFATTKDDATLEGFLRHQRSEAAPVPLTAQEEEFKEIKRQEVGVDVSIDTKRQTLSGVAFPIVAAVVKSLDNFMAGKLQYVQMKLDLDAEEIQLADEAASLMVTSLAGHVPDSAGRYHLYRFDHNYEGDFYHSVVFIYSMPGYSCSVKERMLYSSSKNPLTEMLENGLNLDIAKKLEISEGSELTEEFLLDEIHPKQNLHRPKFAKPKGPAGRGAKRLTKAHNEH